MMRNSHRAGLLLLVAGLLIGGLYLSSLSRHSDGGENSPFTTLGSNDRAVTGTPRMMSGRDTIAIGLDALINLTSGNADIGIGVGACRSVTTGSCDICIGDGIDVPRPDIDNYVNIGGKVYSGPEAVGLRETISAALARALESVGQPFYSKPGSLCPASGSGQP